MRRLSILAAAIAMASAAGCGGESGDLLAIETAGGPSGEPQRTVVVTEDGRGRCGDGELEPIAGDQLIEARELERELTEMPSGERRLPGGEGRSYVARFRDGAARWSEGSPAKPELFARAELLSLKLTRALCA